MPEELRCGAALRSRDGRPPAVAECDGKVGCGHRRSAWKTSALPKG